MIRERGACLRHAPHLRLVDGRQPTRHHERIRTHQRPDDCAGDEEVRRAEQERADQAVEPGAAGGVLLGVANVGPNTAPSVPVHTTMEMARARCSGTGQIGRHVATGQVGGLAGADEERPEQEQREPTELPGDRGGEGRPTDGEAVGDDEPRPPTVAAHVLGERDGDERRARREHGAAEAGQRVAAEQVRGQE